MPHYYVHTPIRGRATADDIIDLDVADAAGLVAIGAITPAATPPAPADQAPTPPPRSKRRAAKVA